MSNPTTSEATIMSRYPDARANELNRLLELVRWRPGQTMLDIQAAGGYVSDAVHRNLDGQVNCICIEPSSELRERIAPDHEVRSDPVHAFGSIPSRSVDVAVGLAGLHHSACITSTLREAHRSLKPGGQLAICDVEVGSPVATWLNGFVDQRCPGGHDGTFIELGAIREQLLAIGFVDVFAARRSVPWVFDSMDDLAEFFRGLFGLASGREETLTAVQSTFEVAIDEGAVSVAWSLLYFAGRRPH